MFHGYMSSMTAPDGSTDVIGEHTDADRAVELARSLLRESLADTTRSERRRLARLGALLDDPRGRELIFALTDQVMRIESRREAAERFAAVVRRHPTRAVGRVDRLMMTIGALLAPRLPRLVMPLIVRRIKHETRGIVLPANDPAFARHVERRRADGVRLNVNPLGEAILSDAEADERMRTVIDRIERPDVDYVSVKVSAIVANLDALAMDHSVDRICERLRTMYRSAEHSAPPTFVNLDMEEYRDLELTLCSFMGVLDEAEFERLDAGIVLQAYLPDSHDALERVGTWAAERHARGGGSVKVRLVKGANLAMERAEAELHGWIAAPYGTKAEVDASYKRLLESALRPEWSEGVRLGLASHNLFDVAWALVLADRLDALARVDFEMLEGMAPAQARAVHARAGSLLMYAPVVADDDFDASIAYLTRRLDENTQPDNFLRSLFTLLPDSPQFEREAERFRASVAERSNVSTVRRRRRAPAETGADRFTNTPDSDVTDPDVRAAIEAAIADPPALQFERVATIDRVDEVVATAVETFRRGQEGDRRSEADPATRRRWLLDTADLMEDERHATIGLLAHMAVKVPHESDPEISEAIDFCRYYATVGRARLDAALAHGLRVAGRGVVTVIGPWNFPYAIPTGGAAAAIAAGNSVILKPAPEVVEVGARIADQFWRAGVPRDVLQLVVCDDGPIGRSLVTHPDIDTVVLTGAHETASMFLDWRPDLRLFAETSGKDAMVITASADLDLAIDDLVSSAFGHAGQKCSAASLGIIVGDVYDDPSFRRRLRDAVASLRVGPSTDLATMVGPLITAPTEKLERGLTRLDGAESWLVEPRCLDADGDGTTWRPGVRLDVADGAWFHRTECFGPVLGLMRADDLNHAIKLQNATPFGLTGGIHTLDDDEVDHWLAHVEVGNAYVNRHITGAIVQRQPFGGWKRSVVGGGSKAGGPGYVAQFASVSDTDAQAAMQAAESSYGDAWQDVFSVGLDPSALTVEANVLRYIPLERVAIRYDGTASPALSLVRLAANVCGVETVESSCAEESDTEFAERMCTLGADRARILCTSLDDDARRILHQHDVAVDTTPPVSDGRLEFQHWVKEQAISRTMHRHGRLIG